MLHRYGFISVALLVSGAIAHASLAQDYSQLGLDIIGETASDLSGSSVALSLDGTTVAIGAPSNSDAGNRAGHVRIYTHDGATWVQRGDDIDGEAAFDGAGTAVSISSDGTVVAIGSPGANSTAGQVQVYAWDGSSWTQRGSDIDGAGAGGRSGTAVSLSSDGSTVAIGAPLTQFIGGTVRIYTWDGSDWMQQGSDLNGELNQDQFGSSVSLSSDGSVVAIGGWLNDGAGIDAGHTRVYAWDGSAWGQRGDDIDGEAEGDQSGTVSLSATGDVVAIGAGSNDGAAEDAGHVRIFAWDGSAWVQRGPDVDGEAADEESGSAVSISSDGNVVVVGAPLSLVPAVRLYVWNGTLWVQRDVTIDGGAELWGFSVSLSGDASVFAVGAPRASGNDPLLDPENGRVRVYNGMSGVGRENLQAAEVPSDIRLDDIYPNPFSDQTRIRIQLDRTSRVVMEIHDALGRRVDTLIEGVIGSGEHEYTWDGTHYSGQPLPSGVYFVRVSAEGATTTRIMSLVR